MQDTGVFARNLTRDPQVAQAVTSLLNHLQHASAPWDSIPAPLGPEIDRFERQHIAAAYARMLGADPRAVAIRQDFLVRTAVTSILFPLEAFEDRLLKLVEERGVRSLFHHVVREFADSGTDFQTLFETSGVCRVAAFDLEDMLRSAAQNHVPVAEIVNRRNTIVQRMWSHLDVDTVPFGWDGVALLWVTALIDLGGMSDTSTTEHYYDD